MSELFPEKHKITEDMLADSRHSLLRQLQKDRFSPYAPGGCLVVALRALYGNPDAGSEYSEVVLKNMTHREETEAKVRLGLDKLKQNNQAFVNLIPSDSPGGQLILAYGSEILCDPYIASHYGRERHSFALLRGETFKRDENGNEDYWGYIMTGTGALIKISCQAGEGSDLRGSIRHVMNGDGNIDAKKEEFFDVIDNVIRNDFDHSGIYPSIDHHHFYLREHDSMNARDIRSIEKFSRNSQRRAIAVAYDIGKKNGT